jgi:putative ABC transport system permease protein
MDTFAADLVYAVRMLRKNPGFAAIAIAALALGIGANTAIFTVVDSVLLKPLPYSGPDRIVKVHRQYPNGHGDSVSVTKYIVWTHSQVFAAMTLYGQSSPGVNLGSEDRHEQVKILSVSHGFFQVFGVSPMQGRVFTPAEDVPNGPALAVMSFNLWQRRFNADPAMVGRAIPLNGVPHTVIGILPKGFASDPPAELWIPMRADPYSTNQGHYLAVAARLKPGATLGQARADMKIVGEEFRRAYPTWMDKTESVGVTPMQEAVVGEIRTALLVLLGAVVFVLLIACANVANLLLARAAVRQREMAVRAAVGASRWRVLRQLLTESVLLAGIGGVFGFALGSWGVRALLLLVPGDIPRMTAADGISTVVPPLDWRVATFTIGIALLTGLLFGLLPAWHISKTDLASSLKEGGGRSGTGRRQNLARSILVIAEIALALVLLVGAALMIRTFKGLSAVNPGIDTHHILTMETSMSSGAYSTTAKASGFSKQVVDRIEGLPGVEAATMTVMLPAAGNGGIDLPFNIVGKTPAKGGQYNGDEQYRWVSPHYFQVFRIPLLRGRVFRETDTANSLPVVVINDKMAKQYWPKEDPVGQVIVIGKGLGPQFDDRPRQIAGVVATTHETGLANGPQGVMYLTQSQIPEGLTTLANSVIPTAWAVRTAGDPMGMRAAIEHEFHAADSMITVTNQKTMEQVLAKSMARQSFNMLLLSIFAGIALLLAAIGIYGLMSYSVEQRVQEIGIRMALGSSRGQMVRLVMGQGMRLAGTGVALGLALAYGVTKVLSSLLFGVKAGDLATFALVAAMLTLVALLASYVPARRAASTDPSRALRV